MNTEIAAIRKEYQLQTLNENDVAENAMEQFARWWNDAMRSNILEVNAMTLATATKTGLPSARIVLLKGFNENGFIFFTNYKSKKGKDLAENPKAALIFFWKEIERQIRIEGDVEKISLQESDEYFSSRPVGSRIGAWASPQSTIIKSRKIIEDNAEKYIHEFKEGIPRPPHWGGYVVKPTSIEFWQGRSNRLHDRILYTRIENKKWKIERLAP